MSRSGGERGAGTVLVIGLVAVVVTLAGLLSVLARAQGARLQARTAADLSALAAASVLLAPPGVVLADPSVARACDLAREVVQRNGATMTRCSVLDHGVVEVWTTRPTVLGAATAVAWAGPAWARGP